MATDGAAARLPWRVGATGLSLQLKVTTNARQGDRVEGVVVDGQGEAWLAIRVRAQAVEGQANAAIAVFVAGLLGVGRREVQITRGERSRWKLLEVSGDGQALAARATAVLALAEGG